jgi:hypothetical protein
MKYAVETLKGTMPELQALAPEQWEEMAEGFDGDVSINWPVYLAAEEKGAALLLTARDSELVGYFGFIVHPHLSASALAASSTPYFVRKRRDRGIILLRLIRMGIDLLNKKGVRYISIRTHTWASCAPILEHLHFKPYETSYMLKLGGENA